MSFGEAFLATDLVYGSFFFPLYLSTGSLFATNFVYWRLFCHEMPLREVLLSPESAGSVFAVKSSPRPSPQRNHGATRCEEGQACTNVAQSQRQTAFDRRLCRVSLWDDSRTRWRVRERERVQETSIFVKSN